MRALIILCTLVGVGCGPPGLPDFDEDGIPDALDCAPEDPERGSALDPFGDGIDQDCDGTDGQDADQDGYASDSGGGPDCDDANASVHPDADEGCDGIDTDCDGAPDADELDGDGDLQPGCAGDCDDDDATRFVGQPEACNGIDDDCDGYVPSVEEDLDGDGVWPCDGDCNDAVASIRPGAEEVCDGFDDDCDGELAAFEIDGDGDGVVPCEGDCDDAAADVFPGKPGWEPPNDGVDSNCDGSDANDLSTAPTWLDGNDEFAHSGDMSCGVGDVDGDGLGDVLVGAHLADTNGQASGAAWLTLGSALATGGDLNLDTVAHARISGDAAFDFLGWSVASAGDVDGDGLDDILIGSYKADTHDLETGATYLFYGASLAAGGSLLAGDADVVFQGQFAFDWSGWAFKGGGDVDGDGKDDLLFGSYGNNDTGFDAGKAYLVFGADVPASGTVNLANAAVHMTGAAAYDLAGYWVEFLPDVDGDGGAEVAVSAINASVTAFESGATYLFWSSTIVGGGTFSLANADVVLHGIGFEDHAGRQFASAGDVDGDGKGDLLVGARFNSDTVLNGGTAYLLLGSTLLAGGASLAAADTTFTATATQQRVGSAVSSAGDVDGDGLDDVLIGAFGDEEGGEFAGKVFLFLGSSLTSGTLSVDAADAAFVGEEAGDTVASMLCPGGDVDGDGLDDLVFGAWGRWSPLAEAGRTYVLLSP